MTGAVCRVRSSGLVESSRYLYHFWPNSRLITCLHANIFHDTAGTDYLNVTRSIIPCRLGGLGWDARCWTVSSSQESLSRIQTRGKSKNLMTRCWKLSELCLSDPTFLTLDRYFVSACVTKHCSKTHRWTASVSLCENETAPFFFTYLYLFCCINGGFQFPTVPFGFPTKLHKKGLRLCFEWVITLNNRWSLLLKRDYEY